MEDIQLLKKRHKMLSNELFALDMKLHRLKFTESEKEWAIRHKNGLLESLERLKKEINANK